VRQPIREFQTFAVAGVFTAAVQALVANLLTPLIAAIFGEADFSSLAFTFNGSRFAYGDFLNSGITFALVATTVYFLVVVPANSLIARARHAPPLDPTMRSCPDCVSAIPRHARRCRYCTVPVEPLGTPAGSRRRRTTNPLAGARAQIGRARRPQRPPSARRATRSPVPGT
jgi:large conductance mechanosensitive channel